MAAPSGWTAPAEAAEFSPPATPLVTCDPYFSVWSNTDKLADSDTTHWTRKRQRLGALVKIDGAPYRLMGAAPEQVPALPQRAHRVTPTQTVYEFEGAGVGLTLRFTTPALPEDIDLLSRPITYVTASARSVDGGEHRVAFYFDGSAELTVNTPDQEAEGQRLDAKGLTGVRLGSVTQNILGSRGDDLRIDWGYLYLAAPAGAPDAAAVGPIEQLRSGFLSGDAAGSESQPAAAADAIAGALSFDLGAVGESEAACWLVVAYDDLQSIQFMHRNLRPYWRRDGLDAEGLLREAVRDYASLIERCDAFDEELMADLRAAGGDDYATLGSLCYRQCLAAGKFVADANGQPIQFCKENHSNGCIGTSDVFYPMSPQFLLFGPSMAKSFLAPFMEYAASERWTFPFAPHDLGTYPKANGQVYGGGERTEENQMPVEESGNLLILMAAVARLEGHTGFADRYWPQLEQWAGYLKQEGFDPDNQLCTDDFAGHLAHNVNLSAKAICGLGAFAKLCEMRGDDERAREYQAIAKQYAGRWVEEAADGDHYRLTFDKPGTWSQKYNLVWDRVLELGLFPDEVVAKEMAYYKRVQNEYGLPLDNRDTYTKLDWVLWTACLTDNDADFAELLAPVMRFVNQTPDRFPLTDWYKTDSGRRVAFTARPVVGGVFMRLLYKTDTWDKWARRDRTGAGDYAPMPEPPKVTVVLPTAAESPSSWRRRFQEPEGDWTAADYDDSSWVLGRSGFGTRHTPGTFVGSRWDSDEIWIRRHFDLKHEDVGSLKLYVHHDEEAQVYLNGVLAADLSGYTAEYVFVPIHEEALATLRPTGNTLAVHCRNSEGGQYIDVGFATVEYPGAAQDPDGVTAQSDAAPLAR